MNVKLNELQEKWGEEWLASSRRAILFLSCRAGKTRVALDIARKRGAKRLLVAFPRNDIQASWEKEIELMGMDVEVEYTTFLSLHKCQGEYDLRIYDEIHEASNNVLDVMSVKGEVIALSGTMTNTTEGNILKKTGLYVCSRYTIEEAVADGVICDYEINVHRIALDTKTPYIKTKKGLVTEKRSFDNISYVLSGMKGKQRKFMELKLISILKNSLAKEEYTKDLIDIYRGERLLIFCGLTDMADRLGVPVYHSKKKEQETFDSFCRGDIPHMACVKMLQAGITIKPIQRILLNYASGASESTAQMICRALGREYDAPEKKATIDLLTINEAFDRQRVETALNFFEKSKINYV